MKRYLLAALAAVVVLNGTAALAHGAGANWPTAFFLNIYDAIVGLTGGAPEYYARWFNHGSNSSGINEALQHCRARFSPVRGCKVKLDSGDTIINEQIVLQAGEWLDGVGGYPNAPGSKLQLNTTLTTANSDCWGECSGHTNDAHPLCAAILIKGSHARLSNFWYQLAGGGTYRADIGVDVSSETASDADTLACSLPTVISRGVTLDHVALSHALYANLSISAWDDNAGSQADHFTCYNCSFGATSPSTPSYTNVYIDDVNTTQDVFFNSEFGGGIVNSNIYVRQGQFKSYGGDGINGNASFPADASTSHVRFCGDELQAIDHTIPYGCASSHGSQRDEANFDYYHWESGGYGGFVSAGVNTFSLFRFSGGSLYALQSGTFDIVDWNTPGIFTLRDSVFNGDAGTAVVDIDCDSGTCPGTAQSNQLLVRLDGNFYETGAVTRDVDYTDAAILLAAPVDGQRPFSAQAAGGSVTPAMCQGTYISNSGASGTTTHTLPYTADVGTICAFFAETAQTMRIDVPGAASCTPLSATCGRIDSDTDNNGEYIGLENVAGSNVTLVKTGTYTWRVAGYRDADGLCDEGDAADGC